MVILLVNEYPPSPLILSVLSEGRVPQEECIEGYEWCSVLAHALRYICSACVHASQTLRVSGCVVKRGSRP